MNWSKYFNPAILFNPDRRERQKFIWDTQYHWGEWLEPGDMEPVKFVGGLLGRVLFGEPVVATAYYAYSARILADAARVLGKEDDARHYNLSIHTLFMRRAERKWAAGVGVRAVEPKDDPIVAILSSFHLRGNFFRLANRSAGIYIGCDHLAQYQRARLSAHERTPTDHRRQRFTGPPGRNYRRSARKWIHCGRSRIGNLPLCLPGD